MAEHLFQVTGFKNFDTETRQSPALIHRSPSGSFTTRIEVTKTDEVTSVYLCLYSTKERSICTDVGVTFSVVNQYSNDNYTMESETYYCGLNGTQVYCCQFLTSRILSEKGFCVDDVVTVLASFFLPSIVVPVFGDPSAVSTIRYETAPRTSAKMFLKAHLSDVSFQIGRNNSEVFHGHKSYIVPDYPVLGDLIMNSKDPVVIDDVAVTVFHTIMRYIYCREIVINKDFVYETLAAADKFAIPDITFAIAALIDMSILPVVLNYATATEKNHMGNLCTHLIRKNVSSFLTPEKFIPLTQSSVAAIVADDELPCEEIVLWEICVDWAREECEQRLRRTAKAKDMRQVMRPFLYDFRFRYMAMDDFTRSPADSGILTLEEVVDVYKFFASETPMTFFQKPQRGPAQAS